MTRWLAPWLSRLAGVLRMGVAAWLGVLILAAFLAAPSPEPRAAGGRPVRLPCGMSWDEFAAIVKTNRSSDAIVAATEKQCKTSGTGDLSAAQPAGENWLMRGRGALKDEARRPGYRRVRELFIAAELQQDFPARHAALLKILPLADTPLLRHRLQIEIAHTALRSGEADALRLAAAAATAAHGEAGSLPKAAEADADLVDAELAVRSGDLRKGLDLVDRALEHDTDYLAAHLLRLDLVVRLSNTRSETEKARYVDQGLASATFVRLLTTRSYAVDARSAIAEQYVETDVAALLTAYLSSLADDREGASRAIAGFLARCAGAEAACSPHVVRRAQGLIDAL